MFYSKGHSSDILATTYNEFSENLKGTERFFLILRKYF